MRVSSPQRTMIQLACLLFLPISLLGHLFYIYYYDYPWFCLGTVTYVYALITLIGFKLYSSPTKLLRIKPSMSLLQFPVFLAPFRPHFSWLNPSYVVSGPWKWKVKVKLLGRVWLFVTPWTVAHQAPLSMGFSRQGYWSGLPFPSPGDLPSPGIEPRSPALKADTLTSELPEKPSCPIAYILNSLFP